jgi:hypothetical protein
MIAAYQKLARSCLVAVLVFAAGGAQGRQNVFEQWETPKRNLNADNCEFYVDGIAEAYMYFDGRHIYKMSVELVSLRPGQNLGGWVRFRDRASGIVGEALLEGVPSFNGSKWTLEFDIEGVVVENHFSRDILEFAFFADTIDANNELVRSWISNRGRNYSWKETMTEPTYVIRDGQTEMRWADFRAKVFDQKRVCATR